LGIEIQEPKILQPRKRYILVVEEKETFVRAPDGSFYVLKDGKKTRYESMDDMPSEIRKELESRLRKAQERPSVDKLEEMTVSKMNDGSFIVHRNNRVERYSSYDALPPDLQKNVDRFEKLHSHGLVDTKRGKDIEIKIRGSQIKYEVDGKVYDSVDAIPDPVTRELLRHWERKHKESRRERELDTFKQRLRSEKDAGAPATITKRWCSSCSKSVKPISGWFGRKKCPFCGKRIY
jgi:ribosome-associated translation inhibitor RaiA